MGVRVTPEFEFGIVGTGFAGIIAALRLKASGRHSFVMLERASKVGGTWRDNTYPGCACDVPTGLYSITSEPKSDWSRAYGKQPEILAYLQDVVGKHGLEPKMQFGRDIVRYEFLESEGLWRLTDRNQQSTTVRHVIAGWGPFNHPKLPEIPGRDSFRGATLHSARWDPSVDLAGQRVAVIGTGASAVQIVPEIAPVVSQLIVFQRSAAWLGDRMDREIPAQKIAQYQRQPWSQWLERGLLYWILEARGRLFTGNRWVHSFFKNQTLKKLEREVQDPELRRKLTPTYEFGCKRILSSDDYWPSFNRENVTLETDPITAITATGIRTASGLEHAVDVIVYATGFEAAEITTDAQVLGRHGRELFSEWQQTGLEAYKGTSVTGYPNFHLILGPNTGLGHSSVVTMMEAQMNYVMDVIALSEAETGAYLDLKPEVQREYNAQIQTQFQGTVWASGCQSWYLNSQGKNTTLYPRLVEHFRARTKHAHRREYDLVQVRA